MVNQFVPKPASSMNVNTESFMPKAQMTTNSSTFVPGIGSVPGTNISAPAYNQSNQPSFTPNKEQASMEQKKVAGIMGMNVSSASFTPSGK